ncbi:MAG: hypothetical protein FWF46_01890, partial [Oscillospiraceae bacterium]|nr:hypothetical protein [Oscillospiraceae bacterium]
MGKRKIILIIVVIIVILILILGIILINNKKTIENNDNNNNIVNIPAFELIYEDNNNNKISTILKKGELPNYDYNIYVYGGNVKIKINNETLDLRDALLTGKINMSDIIGQCVKDAEENKIQTDMYEDGGSMEYRY